MREQPETLDSDVTVSFCDAHQTVGNKPCVTTNTHCRVDDERHCDVISGDVTDTENWCDVTTEVEKMEKFETEVSSSQSPQLKVVDPAVKVKIV